MLKGNSSSARKIRHSPMKQSEDFGATKSHLVSAHTKTSQDLYANIYRLPLKEILQQRREEDHSCSQKKRQRTSRTPTEIYPTILQHKLKSPIIPPHQKSSINYLPSQSIHLKTDRSSKDLQSTYKPRSSLKRMKSELQVPSKQEQNQREKQLETIPRQKSSTKITQRKKEYVSIKLQDMMGLLATYSKLKSKNMQLTQEIGFYYKELSQTKVHNSVLKALSMRID